MNYSQQYQNNVVNKELDETYEFEYKERFAIRDVKKGLTRSQIEVMLSRYMEMHLDTVMVFTAPAKKDIEIRVFGTFESRYFCCELEQHEDNLNTKITDFINENIMEQ
jgi:hypothetical protein